MLKNKRGFTLIELLVVIAIIGTLSGIVLVSLGSARKRARDAVRMSDMRQVVSAQELYYGINEAYFENATQDGIPAIAPYLQALPDPMTAARYQWLNNQTCTPDGQFFCAYAWLEDPGTCAAPTPNHIFIAYEGGTKEDCGAATIIPPTTAGCGCAAWTGW